jgi:hypothetical protein
MPSSEMLRRVALVRTDVSEKLSACIIRVTRIGELHSYNINREGGFCPSKSWKSLIGCLKLSGRDPSTLGNTVKHS